MYRFASCSAPKARALPWTVGETMGTVRRRLGAFGVVVLVLTLLGSSSSSGLPGPLRAWQHTRWSIRREKRARGAPVSTRSARNWTNGNLYIADGTLNEILERLPSGQFVVAAGNGHAGFSGDGGQATRAEIDGPAGMAFSKNGTLYFAGLRE